MFRMTSSYLTEIGRVCLLDYEAQRMANLEEKIASQEKIKDMHGGDFNPAKVKKTLRFDNPFLGKGEKLTYSFLAQGDPYEQLKTE